MNPEQVFDTINKLYQEYNIEYQEFLNYCDELIKLNRQNEIQVYIGEFADKLIENYKIKDIIYFYNQLDIHQNKNDKKIIYYLDILQNIIKEHGYDLKGNFTALEEHNTYDYFNQGETIYNGYCSY